MKTKALLFLPYLAPYRVDVLNELGNYFNITAIFQFDNAPEHNFDQMQLRSKLTINYEIFDRGFNIGTRQIRIGVYKLLRKYKPNVVFSNEYGTTSLILSLYSKLRIFKFIHFATTSDNVEMAINVRWYRKIARFCVLKTTKGIIVYNNEIGDWYKANFNNLIVEVCPNIQNPETIRRNIDEIDIIAGDYIKKYNLAGKNIILYVGRLNKVKGLDLLLNIFSKLQLNNKCLIFVGDGPQKKRLISLSEELSVNDSVLFVGRHEAIHLHAWYRVADLFILPSLHEPFGAVINESLILGLPVACSKYAGAKFFIKTGYNGYVFDPKDEQDFIMNISNSYLLATNKENLMVYSFKDSVKQYYLAYQKCVEN